MQGLVAACDGNVAMAAIRFGIPRKTLSDRYHAGLRDGLSASPDVVAEAVDENLFLAARNLYHVDVRRVDQVDPVSLIGFEKVLITAEALKRLEEWLS